MRRCDAWQKDANNDAGNDYYRGTVRLSGGVGEGGKLLADSDWTHFPSDASNVLTRRYEYRRFTARSIFVSSFYENVLGFRRALDD